MITKIDTAYFETEKTSGVQIEEKKDGLSPQKVLLKYIPYAYKVVNLGNYLAIKQIEACTKENLGLMSWIR